MIIGHGIDLIQIDRIKKLYEKMPEQFIAKILTEKEKEKFTSISTERKYQYLASRFAGKEAFAKAIGIGIGKVSFLDIAVINDSHGKPVIELSATATNYLNSLFQTQQWGILISLTHTNEHASASVIIQTPDIKY